MGSVPSGGRVMKSCSTTRCRTLKATHLHTLEIKTKKTLGPSSEVTTCMDGGGGERETTAAFRAQRVRAYLDKKKQEE